ncbi:hypothetical protein IWQ62_003658, partial [Dispira parvispora]
MVAAAGSASPLSRPSGQVIDTEVFEIADFTTATDWEKCIAKLEEALRHWGLQDGSWGTITEEGTLDPKPDSNQGPYLRDAVVQLDNARSFCLSYSCHPEVGTQVPADPTSSSSVSIRVHNSPSNGSSARWSTVATSDVFDGEQQDPSQPVVYSLGPPSDTYTPGNHNPTGRRSEDNSGRLSTQYHALHNWTTEGRILVLSVVRAESPHYTTLWNVSSETAKLLLSSLAIALRNVGCTLPAFVPVGDVTEAQYLGYRLDGMHQRSPAMGAETETRYRTLSLPYVPKVYSNSEGLLHLFANAVDWTRWATHHGADGLISPTAASPVPAASNSLGMSSVASAWDLIHMMILFHYEFRNTYDRYWKQVEYDKNFYQQPGPSPTPTPVSKPATSTKEPESDVLSPLPFGPHNDPLRYLHLRILFPMRSSRHYMEVPGEITLDATQAPVWFLSCQFAQSASGETLLCDIIEESIAKWVQHLLQQEDASEARQDKDVPPITKKFTSPAISTTSSMKPAHNLGELGQTSWTVELPTGCLDVLQRILELLFEYDDQAEKGMLASSGAVSDMLPSSAHPSVNKLIENCQMGNAVPPGSLLWTLWHSLWKVVTMYNTPFQPVQLLDLLRIIWPHIVRALYWHWENSVAIPNVNTSELLTSYQQRQYTLGRHTTSHSPTESTSRNDDANYPTEVDPFNPEVSPVNLRYTLVHQKLAILNACIVRKIRMEQRAAAEVAESMSLAGRYEQLLHSGAHCSNAESEGPDHAHHYPSQPLLHKAHSSADAFRDTLPVSDYNTLFPQSQRKRLSAFLRAGNNVVGREEEEPDTQVQSTGPVLGHPLSTTEGDFSSASDSDSESESEASLSSSQSSSFHSLPSLAHIQEAGPFGPRASLPPEVHRSESAPVSGGPGHPKKELDSTIIREGHAYPLLSYTLLKTGEPLWVPETQETPLMTEDMIHAQESLFVELGTSEEAALVRAKTLSALLFSDMQAFKAANPGSILEDFVRWYSPRDWVGDAHIAEEGIGAMGNAYVPEGGEGSPSVVKESDTVLPSKEGDSKKCNRDSVDRVDEEPTLQQESSVAPSGQLSLRM